MDPEIQKKNCSKCDSVTKNCLECSIADNRTLDEDGKICVCDIFYVLKDGICQKDESSIVF